MGKAILGAAGALSVFFLGAMSAQAQEVRPSCDMCQSTHMSAEEIAEYGEVDSTDQRILMLDIGSANAGIALVKRGDSNGAAVRPSTAWLQRSTISYRVPPGPD